MQDKANRRRFIAGAVCPRCARMDKIVVNLDTDQRECVACGFSEERPGCDQPGQAAPAVGDTGPVREVPTRVSRAAARRVETPAEAITLIDPGGDGK
jgi:uncharacterized metal-binding protein (TIGR02443 family)